MVELALKGVLLLSYGSKRWGRCLQLRPLAWGCAMLMSSNEDERAVHGGHCRGDMVMRRR